MGGCATSLNQLVADFGIPKPGESGLRVETVSWCSVQFNAKDAKVAKGRSYWIWALGLILHASAPTPSGTGQKPVAALGGILMIKPI